MIYLDNAATTRPLHEVIDAMTDTLTNYYGNPSSTYQFGRMAKQKLNDARQVAAQSIGAKPHEIIFTSGGTESNNTALYSLAYTQEKRHIISTVIEHPSVMNVLKDLETKGFTVTYLPVDDKGIISLDDLERAITPDTSFATIMTVNNEMGSIQPIVEIGNILKKHHILFHTDAVQGYGTYRFNVGTMPIDMLSVSGHKIHGPKGVGFLYVRDTKPFKPFILGGGQEYLRRSGTENLHSIVGFSKAIQLLNQEHCIKELSQLQKYLVAQLEASGIDYAINGSLKPEEKSAKIVNLWLKNIPSSKLLIQLDLKQIMVSAGSACSAGSLQASSVLKQMFPETPERAAQSIRISFSQDNTFEEIQTLVEILKEMTL